MSRVDACASSSVPLARRRRRARRDAAWEALREVVHQHRAIGGVDRAVGNARQRARARRRRGGRGRRAADRPEPFAQRLVVEVRGDRAPSARWMPGDCAHAIEIRLRRAASRSTPERRRCPAPRRRGARRSLLPAMPRQQAVGRLALPSERRRARASSATRARAAPRATAPGSRPSTAFQSPARIAARAFQAICVSVSARSPTCEHTTRAPWGCEVQRAPATRPGPTRSANRFGSRRGVRALRRSAASSGLLRASRSTANTRAPAARAARRCRASPSRGSAQDPSPRARAASRSRPTRAGSSALTRARLAHAALGQQRAHTVPHVGRRRCASAAASAAKTGSHAAALSRPDTKSARASSITSGSPRARRSWNE